MKRWRIPAAGALAALLLGGTYLIGFHQPRGRQIAALDSETQRLRSEQTTLRRNIAALDKVAAHKPDFDAALQLLERLIPAELAQPNLLVQMQAAAQAAGVELVSVTFGQPSVPSGAPQSAVPGTVLAAMPLTVVVNGPYGGISNMLGRIESGKDRAVLVTTLAMTEADTGFPQLTGTWSGQAYALLRAEDPLLAGKGASAGSNPARTTTSPVNR